MNYVITLFKGPAYGIYPSTPSGVYVLDEASLVPILYDLETLAPYPAIPLNTLTNFPSLYTTLEGDSSHPPTSLPNITQLAPAANALHIFPLDPFPPSEIKGIPNSLHTGATSKTALN